MRVITTILTQLLCMVIWFRFTHQFLNPNSAFNFKGVYKL